MTKTFMTIANIEEIAMASAIKVLYGANFTTYFCLRTNANGVKFFYDITVYNNKHLDIWRKNKTTGTSKTYTTIPA